MRWKLLIAASLLSTLVGAGAVLAVTYFASGAAAARDATPAWLPVVTVLLPLAAIAYAAVFVYRHTARRRTLQAAATALLAALLTLAALLFLPRLFAPRATPPTDTPPKTNVG